MWYWINGVWYVGHYLLSLIRFPKRWYISCEVFWLKQGNSNETESRVVMCGSNLHGHFFIIHVCKFMSMTVRVQDTHAINCVRTDCPWTWTQFLRTLVFFRIKILPNLWVCVTIIAVPYLKLSCTQNHFYINFLNTN